MKTAIEQILKNYNLSEEQITNISRDILEIENTRYLNKNQLSTALNLSLRKIEEMIRRRLISYIEINQKIRLFDIEKINEEIKSFEIESLLYKIDKEELEQIINKERVL